jgi:predicted HD superfamily hydrolase involved in NAD metabolism
MAGIPDCNATHNENISGATSKILTADLHDRIVTDLWKTQKHSRVEHILGVAQTSLTLASIFGVDLDKAAIAALLHDRAKNLDREKLLKLNQDGTFKLTKEDLQYPALWHGPAAAWIARDEYDIADPEILDAIEHHTLGHANPSGLLSVLMCADYCEPTRTHDEKHDHLPQMRTLVRQDLKAGLAAVLQSKSEYLISQGKKPHSRIYETLKTLE